MPRINQLSITLLIGAFIAFLFFNGIDLRFFSLAYLLLVGWLLANGIYRYSNGYEIGNLLLPVSIILFWLWLGISIVFSPVFYLSVLNFWWVGIFPLMFLTYTFSINKEPFWQTLFPLLIITAIVLCLYALYQTVILQDQPRASFYNKNSLAALLNLLLIPLLASVWKSKNKTQRYFIYIVVFLFSLVLGLINSRGALIAFVIGLIVLLALAVRQIDIRRLFPVIPVIIIAFVMASLLLQYSPQITGTGMVEQLLTLQNAQDAGHSRFVIWQPAWELFLQQPWRGIGLGTYFLTIPPTLHIDDQSAGFYVHNDYLQIALETGIPGFLLLLLILLATLTRLISSLRTSRRDQPQRLHLIALFAALLTLSIHSVFTYNLYVMPIMLIAGLLLGRFNHTADLLERRHLLCWQPGKLFRPGIYYILLAIITISLASYFLSIGVAHHYQHKAYRLANTNQLETAHQAFRIAQKLAPRVDSAYYADADLLRKSALVLADRPELTKGLLAEAKALLLRAEKLNPLRPQTPYILGMLLEQTSPDAHPDIIEAYQLALERNPRFLPARLRLAQFLIEQDTPDYAYQLLYDGLGYSYRQLTPAYLQLLELNHAAAISRGHHELATRLSGLLVKARQDYSTMLSSPYRNKIFNPY